MDSKIPDEVHFDIPPISSDFVLKELSSLDSNKAIVADGLSLILLKRTAKPIVTAVTMIINLSICCSKFSPLGNWSRYAQYSKRKRKEKSCNKFHTALKLTKICPICKSGKRENRSNYRPISILNILSKVLEKHVHIHLYEFLTTYNLLHLAQSGFRNLHSCETVLAKLASIFASNMKKDKITGIILFFLSTLSFWHGWSHTFAKQIVPLQAQKSCRKQVWILLDQ